MIAHGGLRPLPFSDDESRDTTRTTKGPLTLRLQVEDPEVAAELQQRPEGNERERFALAALRLGVLALRSAQGHVDADAVQRAGQQLITDVRELLTTRAREMTTAMTTTLEGYLDPERGSLPTRLKALTTKDGELERLLRQHLGPDESTLARTLAQSLGANSPVLRALSPQEKGGVLDQLATTLQQALAEQRKAILDQFSLDASDSALSRLVGQVKGEVGKLSAEFSLDRDGSALHKLKGLLDDAKKQIDQHLTLDLEQSALARLKRELHATLDELAKNNNAFHTEVRISLAALQARRQEADRSTRHGAMFEEQVGDLLAREAQRQGDLCQAVGASPGAIRNCKVGDFVLELGPESTAPGAKIVVEAKEHQGYDLKKATAELELARRNREAQRAVFVFSRRSAPAEMGALFRHADDVVVVWDPDDPSTDVNLKAAYGIVRALAVRQARTGATTDKAARDLEAAARAIERQVAQLEQFKAWGETVQKRGADIAGLAAGMRSALQSEVDRLQELAAQLGTAEPD